MNRESRFKTSEVSELTQRRLSQRLFDLVMKVSEEDINGGEMEQNSVKNEKEHILSFYITESNKDEGLIFSLSRSIPGDNTGYEENFEYYWGEGYKNNSPETVHSYIDISHKHLSYPHPNDWHGSYPMLAVDFEEADKIISEIEEALDLKITKE